MSDRTSNSPFALKLGLGLLSGLCWLAAGGAAVGLAWGKSDPVVVAQADDGDAAPAPSPPSGERKAPAPRKSPRPRAERAAAPAPVPAAPATSAQAAPAAPNPAPVAQNFAAQIDQAGAGACASEVNALAVATMPNVVAFNTVSHWSTAEPARKPVSVFIGQRFANGAAVPYGLAGIVASPGAQGGCDGMAMQVLPSPLSCAKLRDTLGKTSKQIGDLAGIPVMAGDLGQVMLVPTAADACVLVSVRVNYGR